jgi:hypothetical protein
MKSWGRISLQEWIYGRVFLFYAILCMQGPRDGPIPRPRNPAKIPLKGFIVSEMNSNSEQARGTNQWNVKASKVIKTPYYASCHEDVEGSEGIAPHILRTVPILILHSKILFFLYPWCSPLLCSVLSHYFLLCMQFYTIPACSSFPCSSFNSCFSSTPQYVFMASRPVPYLPPCSSLCKFYSLSWLCVPSLCSWIQCWVCLAYNRVEI